MRKELNEVGLIDRYLQEKLGEEDARALGTRLLLDQAFAEKVEAQRLAHRLILQYARQVERRRIEAISRQLFKDPGFAYQLKTIFA